MPNHKFKVGQIVELSPAIARNMPGGMYEITKQLPERNGEWPAPGSVGTRLS